MLNEKVIEKSIIIKCRNVTFDDMTSITILDNGKSKNVIVDNDFDNHSR